MFSDKSDFSTFQDDLIKFSNEDGNKSNYFLAI